MDTTDDTEFTKDLSEYVALFRNRKKLLLIPAVLLFAASVAIALYLPPVYRSTATVLIEEPEIPPELVRSTVTSYADQRLHVIRQRVMATRNVATLIDKYNLYPEMRAQKPLSMVVSRFRNDSEMEMVSARVTNPRSGRSSTATIAFTLSYDSSNPRLAQKVVNEMVTSYLSENIRERQGQAAETTKFLAQESERLASRIREQEAVLASFKTQYAGLLPDQLNLNAEMVNRTERTIGEIDRRTDILQERRILLQSQLSNINPYLETENGGVTSISPERRLEQMRLERSRLSVIYGSKHPDVLRLNREIQAMGARGRAPIDTSAIETELNIARRDINTKQKQYSPEHPSVQQLQATISRLEKDLTAARANGIKLAEYATNPAYRQVADQIESADLEINSLARQREERSIQLAKYEERLQTSPEIERAYLAIIRDYDNAQVQYKETKNKQLSAELSQSMEVESKSERFTLIEPPQVPYRPEKPNRPAIIGLGLVAALGLGIGLVLAAGTLDSGIYGARELASITGVPPLAAIPVIATTMDRVKANIVRGIWAILLIGSVAATLWGIHQFVRPLDQLWFSALQRLAF